AVALPTPDRQHEVDAGFVRHLGQLLATVPVRRPPLRRPRHGTAVAAVGAEQAELQPVAVVHGNAVLQACHGALGYCGTMPAVSATFRQNLSCESPHCRISAGVVHLTSTPSLRRRSAASGVFRYVTSGAFIRSTIASGVPPGANRPCQPIR